MNDELAAIAGKHEQLVGILQEKYGIAKEDAKRQVSEFKKTIEHLKKSNANLIRLQQSLKKQKSTKNGLSAQSKRASKRRRPS